MSKAVILSIQPKWCELIASGEKIIEVRKSKPKMEMPFKVFIYCTKPKYPGDDCIALYDGRTGIFCGGKVIGEFVCDYIDYICADSFIVREDAIAALDGTMLSIEQMKSYMDWTPKKPLYLCRDGYGWHISDLKIYDSPKSLSAFSRLRTTGFCGAPQSWCYIREEKP